MKYNYPVKYAIMPIYEQVGWVSGLHELERNYEVVGYIVSKCYVVSKKTKYLEDGREEKEFEVVFPYQRTDYTRIYDWTRVYPEFNYNGNCINSNIVCVLYDDFIDAKEKVEKLNRDILSYNLGIISLKNMEKILSVKKEHEERMERFKYLESKIEEETITMKVNNKPREQSVIVMFNDVDRILPMSIYSFINLYSNETFYVCNVSMKDYEIMVSQIETTGFLKERNDIDCGYSKSRYFLYNDKGIVRILECDFESIEGSYYLKNGSVLCHDDKMNEFYEDNVKGIKVYTTECYEDIINSYRAMPIIKDSLGLPKRLVKNK